ncbi:hypothetical protein DCAR_0101005 [Daucus carota subsp. sativus]|uniref:Uncharacterized protein n=1 Tax=Daucus carota subsp. sativus TaxID=79200 RepID=A0A175YB34_DAUCS|nr:hypothetical protein DCAR_0101005 [Daucus carota subsp. sativus]
MILVVNSSISCKLEFIKFPFLSTKAPVKTPICPREDGCSDSSANCICNARGNPLFFPDTTTALRASEIHVVAVLKGAMTNNKDAVLKDHKLWQNVSLGKDHFE